MKPNTRIWFVLLSLQFAQETLGQISATDLSEYLDKGRVDLLERSLLVNDAGSATFYNYLGRFDLSPHVEGYPSAMPCTTSVGQEIPADDWLVSVAPESKVLMFNENHFIPSSRAFVRALLPKLRSIGYTHLAVEAIRPASSPTSLGEILAEGQFTLEPVFAGLLREALELGYELVPYENTRTPPSSLTTLVEHIGFREQGQAENLFNAISSSATSDKFIVFTGWSHIAEIPVATQGRDEQISWLASRLKTGYGIDPLTVDLTLCSYEPEDGSSMAGRVFIDTGSVIVQGVYAGAVDAQIHLPVPMASRSDFPGFYRSSLGMPFEIPRSFLPEGEAVLVQARYSASADDSVIDRVLVKPGEELPLYLVGGSYKVTSYLADGSVYHEETVTAGTE